MPGLDAKDVIDIQVTVDRSTAADELADACWPPAIRGSSAITGDVAKPDARSTVAGYDRTDDPALWHKRFHASADPGRPTNVHIRVDGWPNQQFALLFVDWLIANPGAQSDYLAAKRAAEGAGASGFRCLCRRQGAVVPRRVSAGVAVGGQPTAGGLVGLP